MHNDLNDKFHVCRNCHTRRAANKRETTIQTKNTMKLCRFCLITIFHHEKTKLLPSTLPGALLATYITFAFSAGVASTVVATTDEKSCDESTDSPNDEHGSTCSSDAKYPNKADLYSPHDADPSNRQIWWNYSIDDLFEKYFSCSEILYGYGDNIKYADDQRNFDYDDDDDSSDDDDDDPDDEEDSSDIHDDTETTNPSTNSETKTATTTPKDSSETIQYSPEWWEEHRKALRKEWIALRDEYRKKINLAPVEAGEFNSVMTVPVYVGDAYEKGRGVFAAEPIKKGTLVSNTDNDHVGFFKDGHSWRKFAVSLPREMACNFIEWR